MQKTSEIWIEKYRQVGALWIHNGNPKQPHVCFTSGLHSGKFFNTDRIIENPLLLDEACSELINLLEQSTNLARVNRVVGPAMGAITIAYNMALNINKSRGDTELPCLFAYTEKEISPTGKEKMIFKRFSIRQGERVLVVEDVLTTGKSVKLTCRAIEQAGSVVEGVIGVFVNRSDLTDLDGRTIVPLIKHTAPQWKPKECPLCARGSKALRPKEIKNWSALVK